MYKQYLVLGDWSGDGHNIYEKILLQSNHPVDVIQDAYLASCKLTGVDLSEEVCSDYQDSYMSVETFDKLKEYGLTDDIIASELDEDCGYFLGNIEYVNLWIWFVLLSLPEESTLVHIVDEIPNINGYWNKKLNKSFGYGLYE